MGDDKPRSAVSDWSKGLITGLLVASAWCFLNSLIAHMTHRG